VPIAVGLAGILFAEAIFIIFFVQMSPATPTRNVSDVGLTSSIGAGLFTQYLLPFEITSLLLLMAIVGAMTLARQGGLLSSRTGVVPGDQVFSRELLDRQDIGDLSPVSTHSTESAEQLLGVEDAHHEEDK
jgi:NADH-ubiquinone/plastoquinone oxidoreductase chain 6